MPLTKPKQELRRNLKAAAFAIDDAAQDLFREAKGYAEHEFLMAMAKIAKPHEHVDRLTRLADEVKAGRIVRLAKYSWTHNRGKAIRHIPPGTPFKLELLNPSKSLLPRTKVNWKDLRH